MKKYIAILRKGNKNKIEYIKNGKKIYEDKDFLYFEFRINDNFYISEKFYLLTPHNTIPEIKERCKEKAIECLKFIKYFNLLDSDGEEFSKLIECGSIFSKINYNEDKETVVFVKKNLDFKFL